MFQKGQSKHPNSGRKKGVGNKKKLKKVAQILADQGIDPVANILDLMDELESPRDKINAWFDILSYCQAKPKEYDPDDDDLDPEDFGDVPTSELLKFIKPVEAK